MRPGERPGRDLALDVRKARVRLDRPAVERGLRQLRPILDRQLKPGTRVVSHDYEIPGWVPDKVEMVKGDFIHDHKVLLFEIR